MVWSKLPRVVRDLSVSARQTDPPRNGRHRNGTRPDHYRGDQRSAGAPGPEPCDHGIETAGSRVRGRENRRRERLSLRAYHEGGQVNIEIGDDGAGIDAAKVKRKAVEKGLFAPNRPRNSVNARPSTYIFQPGFSTAKKVTNSPAVAWVWTWSSLTSKKSAEWSTCSLSWAKAPPSSSRFL